MAFVQRRFSSVSMAMQLTMNGDVSGLVFAERGGSNESNATVDSQADDDCQVSNGAADSDRNGLDHVAIVLQRRSATGQQTLPHISTYNTHKCRQCPIGMGDGTINRAKINPKFFNLRT